jgi:hypothetical protein
MLMDVSKEGKYSKVVEDSFIKFNALNFTEPRKQL